MLELLAENGESGSQDWFMMVIGVGMKLGRGSWFVKLHGVDESSASSQNGSFPIDTAQGFGE